MKIYNDLDTLTTTVSDKMVADIFDVKRKIGYKLEPLALNNLVGGIRLRSLIVVGAETGMGKSYISINIMHSLAKQGVGVCYIDMENGAEDLVDKIHTRWYEGKKNVDTFRHEVEDIANIKYYSPIVIDETTRISKKKRLDTIIEIIKKEASGLLTEVFIIDPLQAISAELDNSKQLNEQAEIVKQLKDLAQKLNICIIINHHLKKSQGYRNFTTGKESDEEKETYRIPTIEDLKGASAISDYATDVWLFYRKAMAVKLEERGDIYFASRKSRAGFTGKCRLKINKETLVLSDYINPITSFLYGQTTQ